MVGEGRRRSVSVSGIVTRKAFCATELQSALRWRLGAEGYKLLALKTAPPHVLAEACLRQYYAGDDKARSGSSCFSFTAPRATANTGDCLWLRYCPLPPAPCTYTQQQQRVIYTCIRHGGATVRTAADCRHAV